MTDPTSNASRARQLIGLLDLTTLNNDDTDEVVARLCARASTREGPVAAVCVWPRFIGTAREALPSADIRIAAVTNFPAGGDNVALAARQTEAAVAAGADEVDVVFPYHAWLWGNRRVGGELVRACKGACGNQVGLKVILETGALVHPDHIADSARMALENGAMKHGLYGECHATPMDLHMPDYGGLHLPPIERKMYRKICYFLGIMINQDGNRFVDEGENFRNYTYAQFGRRVLEQPDQKAWQIFDSKVTNLLYDEYHFKEAHFEEAVSIEALIKKMPGLDQNNALKTIREFNEACGPTDAFDPTALDGLSTTGLSLPKSNWSQPLDSPPFRAYPVTGGITFTYGGLKVSPNGAVMKNSTEAIK